MNSTRLEIFTIGPCENAYQMGFSIGKNFSTLIRSRFEKDLIFQNQLLPFAQSAKSQSLLKPLFDNNKNKFPSYWDELVGIAEGSDVPLLHIMLINFRKEILPFLPKNAEIIDSINAAYVEDDCSDVLVVTDCIAIAAHNEDANVALLGHTYLVKGILKSGLRFIAYTYAGELPSCAFGFNSHGLAFTLNSVPPVEAEILPGGIGRNFISRDLLEAKSLEDAINRVRSADVSVGHSYNLIDFKTRRIVNVETASRNRVSVHEVKETPFFHANAYLHLEVEQVEDENSISRQARAALLSKKSKHDFLSVLGDTDSEKFPIYMAGPTLYTLCSVIIDLDENTVSIIEGNPKEKKISHVFSVSSLDH